MFWLESGIVNTQNFQINYFFFFFFSLQIRNSVYIYFFFLHYHSSAINIQLEEIKDPIEHILSECISVESIRLPLCFGQQNCDLSFSK